MLLVFPQSLHHYPSDPHLDENVEGLAKKTNNPRFAYDCYRRFIQMYSDVVMELGKSFFEERIDAMKERKGVKQDVELDANDLKELEKSDAEKESVDPAGDPVGDQ